MDKVLTDEEKKQIDKAVKRTVDEYGETLEKLGKGNLESRISDLENAMKKVMGFFNTVLPVDFERYLKKEYKGAERASDVRELKV